MKPRIRYSHALECWILRLPVQGLPACDVLHKTWPQALAVLGIPCPEGWQR